MKTKSFIVVPIVILAALCGAVVFYLLGQEAPSSSAAPTTQDSSTQPNTSEAESTAEPATQVSTTEPIQASTQGSTSELPTAEPTQESTELPTAEPTQELTVPPTQEPADEEQEDLLAQIDALIDSVYELKDYYTAQLRAIENDALAQYEALDEQEKTEENKTQIVMTATEKAYELEKACDIEIDTICAKLGYLLMRAEMPQSLVSEVRYAYAYEKTNAKNQLTERYGELLGS